MGDYVRVRSEFGNVNGPAGLHWAEAGDVVSVPDGVARDLLAIGGFTITTDEPEAEEITEPAPKAVHPVTEAPKIVPPKPPVAKAPEFKAPVKE
jgi:hypothetical protein